MIDSELSLEKPLLAVLTCEVITQENIVAVEFHFLTGTVSRKKAQNLGKVKGLSGGADLEVRVLFYDLGPAGEEQEHGLFPGHNLNWQESVI